MPNGILYTLLWEGTCAELITILEDMLENGPRHKFKFHLERLIAFYKQQPANMIVTISYSGQTILSLLLRHWGHQINVKNPDSLWGVFLLYLGHSTGLEFTPRSLIHKIILRSTTGWTQTMINYSKMFFIVARYGKGNLNVAVMGKLWHHLFPDPLEGMMRLRQELREVASQGMS